MSIRIKKVGKGLYTAGLTLPDMPEVKAAWSTPQPMNANQIIKELVQRGANEIDIGDAFYAEDPNWLDK